MFDKSQFLHPMHFQKLKKFLHAKKNHIFSNVMKQDVLKLPFYSQQKSLLVTNTKKETNNWLFLSCWRHKKLLQCANKWSSTCKCCVFYEKTWCFLLQLQNLCSFLNEFMHLFFFSACQFGSCHFRSNRIQLKWQK